MAHLTTYRIEHLIWSINQLSRELSAINFDSSQACKLIDQAEHKLCEAANLLYTDATCIGCGCTGHKQCATEDGWGCYWLLVDYEGQWGVCSECSDKLLSWQG